MNLSSRLFTCLLIGTLAACSHPLRIVGTGDILSFSGERDCIYEDFSEYTGDGQPCPNWVAGDYQESYLAIPIFGADFLRWEGCPNPMGPVCDFDVPAEIVDASWGQEAPPLTAHFGDFYQFHTFSHRVIDAVYDEQRDLLVTLGDDNQLHVLNVFTRESTSLSLAVAGHAVAISADGTQAAVGHDGFVSHIDMSTLSVIDLLPVPTEVFDIEIPGNGFIYTSPEGLSRTRASVVEIATGAISEFPLMGGNYRIKTHPDLDAIYSTNWGLTSEVLTRYDITGGLPVRERSLFHSGNSLLCNDLWFSDDGKKLFGPCNDVFYASDDPVMDMTLAATLPIDNQGFFVNRGISQQGSELLVTAPYPRNEIRVFDYPSLTETDRFTLPDFWPDFLNFELGANFVFCMSAPMRNLENPESTISP